MALREKSRGRSICSSVSQYRSLIFGPLKRPELKQSCHLRIPAGSDLPWKALGEGVNHFLLVIQLLL